MARERARNRAHLNAPGDVEVLKVSKGRPAMSVKSFSALQELLLQDVSVAFEPLPDGYLRAIGEIRGNRVEVLVKSEAEGRAAIAKMVPVRG